MSFNQMSQSNQRPGASLWLLMAALMVAASKPVETPGFSAETWFLRQATVVTVTVQADPMDIPVDGATSRITVTVTDGDGNPIADGTVVTLTTTLGEIEPATGLTADGQVTATLTSGAVPGQVVVWATSDSRVGSATVTFHPAELSILKRALSGSLAEPGQIVTYTLTFQNSGLAVARGVTITDHLPAQFIEPAFIASGVPVTVTPGRPFEWRAGDLPAGAGGTITITARLDPAYPWKASQSLFNEASISTVTAEGDYGNNRNGALILVVTADLYLTKQLTSSDTTFVPRAMIRYNITVGNYGPAVPRDVVISDTFPIHTTWFSDTSSQQGFSRRFEDGVVIWSTDVLTHSVTIILWVKLAEDAPGGALLVNHAAATTSTVESDKANNQAQSIPATVHALNLRVTKTAPSRAEPGQVLTYTIAYQNVGTLPAPGAVLTDVLPPQVDFLRSSPAPSSGSDGTYVWTLGDVPAGVGGTITLVGQVAPDGAVGTVLTNTVAISASTAESYRGDNQAQATTTVVPGEPQVITVVAEPGAVSVGGSPASITATVEDRWGNAVEDGTLVELATTLGTITPAVTATTRGLVSATLSPGTVSGEAVVTALAGEVTGTTRVTIRPGPPAVVALEAEPASPTVEDTVTIALTAQDQYDNAVADGTPVTFATTLGVITPTLTATTAGAATATLTSTVAGTALITATVSDLPPEVITVTVRSGAPFILTLIADPPAIEVGGASTAITATVRDRFGNAVADGAAVTFTTDLGTIHGGQVYTTTTSGGRAWAVLVSGRQRGTATVQARVDGVVGEITIPFTGYGYRVYLPVTLKGHQQPRWSGH